MSKFKKLNIFKKSVQKKDHWFERNQSYWSFGATIISALALIISIFVMLDQRNFANSQLSLAKEQLLFSKIQFDSSNQVSKDQLAFAKAQFDSGNAESRKNEIKSDERFNIQRRINNEQLKSQQYNSKIQIESDKPILTIESIRILSPTSLSFSISNKGRRPCELNKISLTTINDDSSLTFDYDTTTIRNNISVNQIADFTVQAGPIHVYWDTHTFDLMAHLENTYFIVNMEFYDVIINRMEVYRCVIDPSDPPVKIEDKIQFEMMDDRNAVKYLQEYTESANPSTLKEFF